MSCTTEDITIVKGDTFSRVIRWETTPAVHKAITGIAATTPAAITAVGHGLADGWRVAITNVVGMKQINAKHAVPRSADYHQINYVDADHFTLNGVDASGYDAYVSGGVVQYNTPIDLSGYTARMTIRNRVGGAVIVALTDAAGIGINNTAKTITLTLSAADTAAFTATHGVYDLEMVSGAGAATRILAGKVSFKTKVTT